MKSDKDWKKELDELSFNVCRLGHTEAPFTGKFLHQKDQGMYLCKCCKTPLFYSNAKFDSGCGWPSFDAAIEGKVKYLEDTSHGMQRTEIKCIVCDSHLGHVFNDGPTETGARYCVNSVSMDFAKKADD